MTTDLEQKNVDLFEVGRDKPLAGEGEPLPTDTFVRWAIGPEPLYLNFSEPTILNLQNKEWKDDYVVIPKPATNGSWIYLLIIGNATGLPPNPNPRQFIAAAHPVSLIPINHPIHRSSDPKNNRISRSTFTATISRSSSNPLPLSTYPADHQTSNSTSTIPPVGTSSSSPAVASLSSLSKPIILALGSSIATSPGTPPRGSRCRYWSRRMNCGRS